MAKKIVSEMSVTHLHDTIGMYPDSPCPWLTWEQCVAQAIREVINSLHDPDVKFVCQCEGCDCPHCKQCGRHYDPACSEGRNVCDACQIGQASQEAEAITEAFGGNYEEAARFMGW